SVREGDRGELRLRWLDEQEEGTDGRQADAGEASPDRNRDSRSRRDGGHGARTYSKITDDTISAITNPLPGSVRHVVEAAWSRSTARSSASSSAGRPWSASPRSLVVLSRRGNGAGAAKPRRRLSIRGGGRRRVGAGDLRDSGRGCR